MNIKKKTTFRELLLKIDKKRDESTNELAWMFRDMLSTYGVTPSEWDLRVERYYRKLHTNAAGKVDKKRVDQDKSNLTRALTRNSLPWKRFREGLSVLGPESYVMSFQLNFPGDRKQIHKMLVRNRYADQQMEGVEDEETDDVK